MATLILLFIMAFLQLSQHFTEAQIGVDYGLDGNNLISQQKVVNLLKQIGITSMRIYRPDQPTLQALKDAGGFQLVLGVGKNEEAIPYLAVQQNANEWVRTNVVPFSSFIKYVVVGNEVDPASQQSIARLVGPAMQNILNALVDNNLNQQIKVSTSINYNLKTDGCFPPSTCDFKDKAYMGPIIDILKNNDSPLLVSIYPFFTYLNNPPGIIPLSYALFEYNGIRFTDNNGLGYQNLFDAMVDSVYAAIGKTGRMAAENGGGLKVAASESGWSSGGSPKHPEAEGLASNDEEADIAGRYYQNLINHVNKGTPLTPGQPIETYLFAMFDENLKQGDDKERSFGLFHPDGTPKYNINF